MAAAKTLVIPFEDVEGSKEGPSNYLCPNEDVRIWREFVKGKLVRKGGYIILCTAKSTSTSITLRSNIPKGWTLLDSKDKDRSKHNSMFWQYRIYQVS